MDKQVNWSHKEKRTAYYFRIVLFLKSLELIPYSGIQTTLVLNRESRMFYRASLLLAKSQALLHCASLKPFAAAT